MKPFNLSEWLKNKSCKVVTRRGNSVRIICTDRKHGEDNLPVVFLEESPDGIGEFLLSCKADGTCDIYETQYDLFFADEEDELSEDEKIRKGLIKGLSAMRYIHHRQTFSDDAINIDDTIAWLEKQGENKSSWSEEDEKMLKSIIYCVDGTPLLDSDQINWLKSLKPHWKPSEEQLEALKYVIDYFGELTEHFAEYYETKSLYKWT